MRTRSLDQTAKALSRLSRERDHSFGCRTEWPTELGEDLWLMSPELISLHGTPVYKTLTETQRHRLSLFEAVNFFSLNIHGEQHLLEGLARQIERGGSGGVTEYLRHFYGEENKHQSIFSDFCQRYAGKVYPERRIAQTCASAPGEVEFLFFARAMVFEEIVDVYNRTMSRDRRLPLFVREIHQMHHRDEARHLAFGRTLIPALFERYRAEWSTDVTHSIRRRLAAYLDGVWAEYFNPAVYRDAGIRDPYLARRRALSCPVRLEQRRRATARCTRFLLDQGILVEGAR